MQRRLMAMLSGFFGLLAGLLATIGLYGVISYTVARRTNEIGIRLALGAGRGVVARLILGEPAWLLGIGLAVGTLLAVAVARTARGMLFGLHPYDPLTIGTAVVILTDRSAVIRRIRGIRILGCGFLWTTVKYCPENDGTISDRCFDSPVRIRMLLVAAKDDHIARRKFVLFPRNHEFHPARLACQILPCPQAVRNPSHL